jgi:hypothetical protein
MRARVVPTGVASSISCCWPRISIRKRPLTLSRRSALMAIALKRPA